MECLLNNLSCLAFRTNPSSPRSLSLIQIWFLLRKDRETLLNEIQSAAEQSNRPILPAPSTRLSCSPSSVNHSTDLSNLLENQNYPQIASILNARTLNNEKLFDRILDEYQFKIPGSSSFLSPHTPPIESVRFRRIDRSPSSINPSRSHRSPAHRAALPPRQSRQASANPQDDLPRPTSGFALVTLTRPQPSFSLLFVFLSFSSFTCAVRLEQCLLVCKYDVKDVYSLLRNNNGSCFRARKSAPPYTHTQQE